MLIPQTKFTIETKFLSSFLPGFSPLNTLRARLLAPLLVYPKITFDSRHLSTATVSPHTPSSQTVADIINYAYSSRYASSPKQIPNIATDAPGAKNLTTIVSLLRLNNHQLVAGTYRLVYASQLEAFSLFQMPPGHSWPHSSRKPGELERFSLHPIFDLIPRHYPRLKPHVDNFKRLVLRSLWPYGMAILKKNGVKFVYFTLAPHVYKFVLSAGIQPQKVSSTLAVSPKLTSLQRLFGKYWPRNFSSNQPALYLAPWHIINP